MGNAEGNEASIQDSDGIVFTRKIEEYITGIDMGSVEEATDQLWHSAPTEAMTDDEILGIIGHELGHSAMKHVDKQSKITVATSFISYAAWGWFAQSALVASAFAFQAPCLHGGLFVYQHLFGPSLEDVT